MFRSLHKIVANVDKVLLISDVGMSMNHQDAVQSCLGHRGTQGYVLMRRRALNDRSLTAFVAGITKIGDAKTSNSDSKDLCASDRSPAG